MPSHADPLLQPYQLKHLRLKNRLMSTSHEPAYSEDGMPKTRYRLYHAEKAKGGIALTMTAGSAVVSRESPPAFGNLHAYKDEIVPWLRELADDCHEHGAAVNNFHLAALLGWQDVAQRYRRSSVGAFWLTINMGVLIGALGLIFGTIFRSPMSEFLPFICVGLIMWGYWR